jgi:peptidoglycan hydrolase-like amidase
MPPQPSSPFLLQMPINNRPTPRPSVHLGRIVLALTVLLVPILLVSQPLPLYPKAAHPTLKPITLSADTLDTLSTRPSYHAVMARGGVVQADGLPSANMQPADVNRIRVGISSDDMTQYELPSATLSATGEYRIWVPATRQLLWRGLPGWKVVVTVDRQGFWLAPQQGPQVGQKLGPFATRIFAEPMGPNSYISLPDRTRKGKTPNYRGLIWIERGNTSNQRLMVINDIDLQDYLRAVVPNELPISFGVQAVKAQAVAARNYALRPRDKVWPQFDICDSQYCQAYYGQQTESPGTDAALRDTDGLVSLYNGDLILALYSSANGGHSEDYGNVFADPKSQTFPTQSPPYLVGKPDIPSAVLPLGSLANEAVARQFWGQATWPGFDGLSSLNRWQRVWTRPQLEGLLARNLDKMSTDGLTKNAIKPAWQPGSPFGVLQALTVVQRGRSGKAMAVRVETSTGVWTVEREFAIRKLLTSPEGKMLPSANIVITYQPITGATTADSWMIHGGGFGHGVGMSQYGASFLSGKGVAWPQILQHYYSGIAIGTIPLVGRVGQGVTTHFYGSGNRAILHVKTADRSGLSQPVLLAFNGQGLQVQPSGQLHQRFEVSGYLRPNMRNELTLLPLAGPSNGPITVWLEVVEPLPNSPGPAVASR